MYNQSKWVEAMEYPVQNSKRWLDSMYNIGFFLMRHITHVLF